MAVKYAAVLLPLLAVLTSGCGQQVGTTDFAVASVVNAAAVAGSQLIQESPGPQNKSARHVIREGELRFETVDRNATRTAIQEFVDLHHGYLADDREQRDSGTLEQIMVIRVPSDQFDGLLSDVSQGVPRFDRREIQAIDVTEEFVDIEARVKTKKETETRYRDLLKQANTVEEILKIEEQIDKLRAEIESTEGRLRLLQDRESYSTLRVSFYETLARSSDFFGRVKKSFSIGWMFVIEATITLVAMWPLMVIAVAFLLVILWSSRKSVARKVVR